VTLVTKLLLAALLLQVALTFGLLLWLGSIRVPLITSRQVRMKDIAISRDGWPERAKQLANAVDNQFQLPVLFYVAVVLTLWVGTGTWLEVLLGWAFVVSRAIHAAIHTTSNFVPRRFTVYVVGLFILMAYWIVLAIKLVLL
jgi:hypothetical protein